MNCKFEEIALKDECRRTKYELQNALFTKFDVRKGRNTDESNEDRYWMAKLDNFLEKEKYKNFKYYIQQNTVTSN